MSRIISTLTMMAVFLGAPLLGVLLKGESLVGYLRFPPATMEPGVSSFSWMVFIFVALFIIIATFPFWRRLPKKNQSTASARTKESPKSFPGWGGLAAAGVVLFWILAWNRYDWFEPLQRYTFFPLWFSFIILINALAVRFAGNSLLTSRPLYFGLLFPVSAIFWWTFEYLNRFVQNWYYIGISEIGGGQYFAEATLAFSTVLPAVMSVQFILLHTDLFAAGYSDFPPMPWVTSKTVWGGIGIASILALVLMGWRPNLTFPLVWILPGLLWVTYQRWNDYLNSMLRDITQGDWTLVWTSACAALICGFFWEMWNVHSLAKWIYTIPAVDRFHLFEMPLLGYAGYLPFGVICYLVANSFFSSVSPDAEAVLTEDMRNSG